MILDEIGRLLRKAKKRRKERKQREAELPKTPIPIKRPGRERRKTPFTPYTPIEGPREGIYVVEQEEGEEEKKTKKVVKEGERSKEAEKTEVVKQGGREVEKTREVVKEGARRKQGEKKVIESEEDIQQRIRESPFKLKFGTVNINDLTSGAEKRRKKKKKRRGKGVRKSFAVEKPEKGTETIKKLRKVNRVVPLITITQGVEKKVVSYATIKWQEDSQELLYSIHEPELTSKEKELLEEVKDILREKLDVDFAKIRGAQAYNYIITEFNKVVNKIGLDLTPEQELKFNYYIYRDFIGLGKLEPLMHDPDIEDISCVGYGIPLFIYHRDPLFNEISTNVVFKSKEELDSFVMKLAQKCGKNLTLTEPLMDGALPDGSRVQATLGVEEIARRGSNFTIRKFTEKPMTPVDLVEYDTINPEILAYLWLVIEHNLSILISGATATGKTTFLNALSLFIKPEFKIVSIEDSVTGDTELLIKNPEGFKRTRIEELFNELKTRKSQKRIGLNGLELFTLGEENKMRLEQPKSLLKHEVNKKIYEVTTASGRKVKTTGDHSLFSLDEEGRVAPISVSELDEEDFIAVPRKLPNNNKGLREINLLEHAGELKNAFFKGEEIKNLLENENVEDALNISRSKYNRWKRKGIISCKEFNKLEEGIRDEVNAGEVVVYARKSKIRLPAVIPVTDNLLTLVGLWIGDGCYDKRSVIITNKNEKCLNTVKKFCERLNITPREHSDGASLMMNSIILKKVFTEILNLKGKAYSKRIPDWVFNLSKEQTGKVLKGYFSADGCVTSKEVEVTSCSKDLIKDVQTLLLYHGIVGRTTWRKEKDNTYKMRIGHTLMLREFKKGINFIHDYKKRALSELCNRENTHGTSDVIPLPKKFYKSIKKVLKNHEEKELMKDLSENDIYWDKVKEVEDLGRKRIFVYDFSVPEVENFTCNNVIAHNTAELRLPHPNWIAEVARQGFGGEKYGEITMYELLKSGLRQRPDYIIVGEVRGKEATVMFQGMATGHASLGTIHADSMPAVIDRLTNKPIDLPKAMLDNLDVVVFLEKFKVEGVFIRKLKEIAEIVGYDYKRKELVSNSAYRWSQEKEGFESFDSVVMDRIREKGGYTINELKTDIQRRIKLLQYMVDEEVKDYRKFSTYVNKYYNNPSFVDDL